MLWQWADPSPDVASATHAYCALKGLAPLEPIRREQYPFFMQEMLAGRLVAVSSLEALPREADIDRESARRRGIKSILCLPLSVGSDRPLAPSGSTPFWRSATGRTRSSRDCG